jgi:hypothetical protein
MDLFSPILFIPLGVPGLISGRELFVQGIHLALELRACHHVTAAACVHRWIDHSTRKPVRMRNCRHSLTQ